MKTILSVIYDNDSGGAEILCYEFIRATQNKYRHHVVILNGEKNTLQFDKIAKTYTLGYSVRNGKMATFYSFLRYIRLVLSIRPSAIISNAWIPLLFNVPLLPFFNIIQYHHSDFVHEKVSMLRALSIRLSGVFRARNIVLTREVQNAFRQQFGFVPICLHNPCRIDFRGLKSTKDRLLSSQVNLLFIGRLEEIKGIEDLIEIERLLRPYSQFSWTVVGEGSYCEKIRDIGDIRYIPYIEKPGEIYLESDFLILTSKYEGFGNVVVEALCAGCTPLTYSTSGTRAIHDLTGLLRFPDMNTPESMKELILQTWEKREKISSEKINTLRTQFSLNSWVTAVEEIVAIK